MKNLKIKFSLLAIALFATISTVSAQVSVTGGADFVSSYVWRGSYCGGASVQPYAELGVGGFAVGAWGSTGIVNSEEKELDYYVSYGVGNFSVALTDYWCMGESYPYLGAGHTYEASLAYTFGEKFPLSIAVNTMFAGKTDVNSNGERAYSTYIALGYPVTIKDVVNIDFELGVTPADGAYADNFAVCNISARVSKAIEITDKFELPVFVDAIVNPSKSGDNAYLLAGFSLSF
ncbi:MAG: hypothetical protein R3Y26_11890 [Rikenellaceae bacterium]